MRHQLLAAVARRSFYNTSPFDFARLLDDPNYVAANLHAYIGAYSPNVRDVMERFEFAAQVDRMNEKDLRFQVGGCQMLTDRPIGWASRYAQARVLTGGWGMADHTTTDGPHLDSLSIRGFRGVPRLDVGRLGRVTLLVGRNGVGKTTVLEAVRLYAARGSLSVLHEILTRHDELKTWADDDGGLDEQPVLDALFSGRHPEMHSSFAVGPMNGAPLVCVTLVAPDEVAEDQLKLLQLGGRRVAGPVLQISFGNHQQHHSYFDRIGPADEAQRQHGRRWRHPSPTRELAAGGCLCCSGDRANPAIG